MARLDGNPTLLNALHNNTPFVYAHLVKFERPTATPVAGSMGVFSLDFAENYAYFSDAAFDVVFDDGSKNTNGTSNGAQTYIANKLISIGNIADSTEVKVTSTSLTLDATPVDASFTDSIAITLVSGNLTITAASTSFPEAGFRVGDVISFSSGVNLGCDFQIDRIVTDNSVQVTTVTKAELVKPAKRTASGALNILTLNEATAPLNIQVGDTVVGEGIPANTTILATNGTHSFNVSNNIDSLSLTESTQVTFLNPGRTHSATSLILSMTAAEITGLLHSSAADKVSFVNRRITIYKAFFYADNPHTFIGTPLKIFSGVITNASFEEDPAKGARVTWNLSNFLGDFRRIRGRLTSHEAHQGITNTGGVDSKNALRPAYAEDRGFEHSELSFNMIAQYGDYDKEPKYKKKKVGGFLGITALGGQNIQVPDGYKYIPVTREVDIRFDLDAKYLPVVYGVQRVKGIPVFADVDKDLTGDRQSSVFTANAICEGPIQSVLNIYIDDKALSCTSIDDAKKRNPSASGSTAAEIEEAQNADVRCIGQADQGIVLEGNAPSTAFRAAHPVTNNAYQTHGFTDGTGYGLAGVGFSSSGMALQWNTSGLSFQSGAKGITHEKAIYITSPMTSYVEIHNGLYDQRASALLSDQAATGGGFILQDQAGLLNDPEKYWGSKHRLLDTAYSVNNFVIGEEETSIPSIEYVVSGKLLECFNYDGSYIHSSLPTFSSENHANFKEGNVVEIRTTFNFTSTTTKLNSSGEIVLIGDGVGSGETAISLSADGLLFSTTIIDKFFYRDQYGDSNYRFRWDLTAAQQTLLSETGYFYMKLGSNDWHMLTYDAQDVPSLAQITVAEIFTAEVTQTSSGSSAFTGTLSDVSFASDSAYNLTNADLMFFQPNGGGREGGPDDYLTRSAVIPGNITQITGGNGVTIPGTTSTDALASGTKVTIVNQVKFSSNASNVDNIYNGKKVVFTRKTTQGVNIERTIVDYDGNTKVATLDSDPSSGLLEAGDIVNLTAQSSDRPQRVSGETLGAGDLRPSNNFAMIALDYIKSERYGLDIAQTEISLTDFQLAAVECDTQSDVEVEFASSVSLTAGTVYRRYQNGHEKWRGTVVATATGTSHTFTNITGKLASKFNTFSERSSGDLVYEGTSLFRIDSDDGTATGGNFQTVVQTSISNHADFIASPTIFKVGSGAGPSTLTMVGHNFTDRTTGNPVNSYSLYDSDDILYWKYLGWTEQRQRYVTRHQGNLVVDTSNPVLDNLKGILAHFNALIYFADGKLKLKVTAARNSEGPESDSNFDDSNPDVDVRVRYITDEDIIGKISIKDEGLNKSHNTISASIPDPALDFNDRSITFMDSIFKKEDRGVTKSANYSLPGITNYYNARMGAKQALNASRVSRTISFTMRPAGIAILPGELIRVNYPRFGWGTGTEVLFRVKSVGIAKDCLVSITATEHDDSVYVITKNIKSAFFKDEIVAQAARTPGAPTMLTPQSASTASPNKIRWSAASGISQSTGRYEVWRAAGFSGNAATAVTAHAELIDDVPANQTEVMDLKTTSTTSVSFIYWVRAYNVEAPQTTSGIRKGVKKYFGPFNDNSDYGGVGQSAAARLALKALEEPISMNFSTNGITVPTDKDGNNPVFSAVNGFITVEIGNTDITNQVTGFSLSNLSNFSSGQFSISGSNYTVTGMGADTASIDVTAAIPANSTTGLSAGTTITKKFTLNKTRAGADGTTGSDGATGAAGAAGVDAYTINGTNENHTFVADTTGAVSMTGFSCVFTVFKGTQAYTYDSSSPYDANSFRYGSITATNVTQSVATNGTISLAGGSAIASGLTVITGSLLVPIIDNATGTTVATKTITFSKSIKASRDGAIFTFEESTNSNISAANASDFAGSLSNAAAQAAATAVIAASIDGFLRANDRVTITDNSANKAGTRIFTGTGTASAASVAASDFGPLVVETFNGSVIVEGTLSADRLAANTTTTNTLNVGSNIVLNNNGKFYTQNKTAFTDNDAGFFLGYDSTAHKLNIGNASNFLKWDGTNVLISGNINFTNAASIDLSDFNNDSGFTDDTAANAAQGTANTGVANASTAQGTANTANSRAQNFDTSGDIFQGISVGTGGHVRGGQSAFNNGVGFFLGYSGSAYKFSIGNSSGGFLTWDGSSLNINGNISFANSPNISSFTNDTGFTDDTAANTAQGTANTGVANAATAQSTANTGVANAATAQSTANTANTAAGTAQGTANTANSRAQNFDTSGDIFQGISVGTGGHVRGGQSAFNNGTGFFLGYSGSAYKFSIGNAGGQGLTWDGTNLTVVGSITIQNPSSINLSSFNNDSGFTDDTAAAAAQSTANTANTAAGNASTAASNASTAASTAQGTANTANSRAQNFNTSGNINSGITIISGGSITVGNIVIDGNNSRILISD